MSGLIAAVDVGGTFIDVVLTDQTSGRTGIAKVLHRKGGQGSDILAALVSLASDMGVDAPGVESVVVGTTVVTNALLEERLARTALFTTEGFRDVLEIARMTRASSYDLHKRRAPVVSPRELRFEVPERIDFRGETIRPLDLEAVREQIAELRKAGVEAIAVSLLFSFVNSANERAVGAELAKLNLPVSLSSDVLPVFREYERTSTTVLNAATMPVMGQFLDGLKDLGGGSTRVYVMGSAGGSLTVAEARRYPIKCAMSGPAGGAVGAIELAQQHGLDAVLTLDVGGTSSDIALLREQRIEETDNRIIGGYPIAVGSAEIETVGAGGGSIAYLDGAGLLRVGPRSAGSNPGPVCYSGGGVEPAVTDAHLALNRLGAASMLGGDFPLDRPAAVAAIREKIAAPLALTWQRAALGILQIATANIVRTVRAMSTERGQDPRRMALLAFGGAGPLHAVEVARSLAIPTVIVPFYSGVFSAFGLLGVDIAYDAQRTWLRALPSIKQADLEGVCDEMLSGVLDRTREDGLSPEHLETRWSVDLRYVGQSHALTVGLNAVSPAAIATSRTLFLAEHQRRYGHASEILPVELLNVRLRVSKPRSAPVIVQSALTGDCEPVTSRDVWFSEDQPLVTPVFNRASLGAGWRVTGPAIIEQFDSVTVIGPGDVAEVLPGSHALSITIKPQQERLQNALPEGEHL